MTTVISKPLRVMQVISTYPNFINHFYAQNPNIVSMDYHTQNEAFANYGFFAPHIIAPYTKELGCVQELTFSNAEPLQRAWLKEQGLSTDLKPGWEADLLRMRIDEFKPDVLYVFSPYTFNSALRDRLTHQPGLVVSWRCATLQNNWDWSAFDVILTGLPSIMDFAPKLGARSAEMFSPGFPLHLVKELVSIPQDTDLVFVGSLTGTRRIAMLDSVARAAKQYGFSLALHLSGDFSHLTPSMVPYLKQPVFGLDAMRCLRRGRMVIDSRTPVYLSDRHGYPIKDISEDENCSMRLFEATGCGALVLALEGVSRWFDWGKEIISYKNPQDLVDKIRHFIANPEERENIASAGQNRCLTEYNMKRNTERFMDIVDKNLNKPSVRPKPFEVIAPNEPKSYTPNSMFNEILSNSYLKKMGWFSSYHRQAIVDDNGAPLPWLSYPAVNLLEERSPYGINVFEYGCGSSTLWWAKRARRVVVVEHNEQWFKTMKEQFPDNVRPVRRELETGGDYSKTVAMIKNIKFDIIVIDGRDRVNCAYNCLDSLSPSGVVVFDNTDRLEYMPGREFLVEAGFKELRLTGLASMVLNVGSCTSIFYKDDNCLGL
ncbi:glycosyltransferase [Desulfovibrio sp. UCD-KL4C]|uniref:glycosyltransferase family protein n=1 Tax=Desulfovibrio sp. UCD-KL4C TaxID=2578120 RepID=UPI0025BCD614|nr:glycosyltransferase [Desulfovibrio sp. UCD-KL4C]